MKLDGFEILTVDIPMRMSVDHTLAKRRHARNILVKATTADGAHGWGESCPREYVTGESIESVLEDLEQTIIPRLLGREFADLAEASAGLEEIIDSLPRNQQAAFCAAELAVLDLVSRATGVSAGEMLGPIKSEKRRYSAVIVSEDPDKIREQCALMRKFGVDEVKVKVGPSLETNLRILESGREVLGSEVKLRLDANSAWTAEESIRQLEAMSSYDLHGVEQPVPADDLAGMVAVTAAGIVPVVADESLCSLADAKQLVASKGCDIFNVRVSKCGGLVNAGRIERIAREAGLKCQLGAQVGETGILSAAGRQFATRCEPLWCEGSYGALLLEEDITDPDITLGPGGFAPALVEPGLGVAVDEQRVSKRTVQTLKLPK